MERRVEREELDIVALCCSIDHVLNSEEGGIPFRNMGAGKGINPILQKDDPGLDSTVCACDGEGEAPGGILGIIGASGDEDDYRGRFALS